MGRPIGVERVITSSRQSLVSTPRGSGSDDKIHRRWTRIAAAGIACCWLIGAFVSAAHASETRVNDTSISTLNAYVQSIAAANPVKTDQDLAKAAARIGKDNALVRLRDFVQGIAVDRAQSIKTLPKLAEADNAVDALRDFLSPAPAAPPAKKPVPAVIKPSAPAVEASYVGTKVCLGCHTSQAEAFGHTLMGRLLAQGKMQCESCHGPGSQHVKLGGGRNVGGIISFRSNDQTRTAEENNGICLGCHQRGDRTYWSGSPHETRGLACSDCHTVMKAVSRKFQLKTAFEPETCFQCHKDRRAQMARSSHMPMREGKIVCSDCHNPHGSFTESLLRKASINETCYTCHAEKRGPFLFEHLPVRENCLNCHDPHGSVNEFMLKIARPRLCTECHTFGHGTTTGPLVVQAISRSCQNCHTEVHGTNHPSGALLHR
jgi:DmsE family decaheme c-type cytochrome